MVEPGIHHSPRRYGPFGIESSNLSGCIEQKGKSMTEAETLGKPTDEKMKLMDATYKQAIVDGGYITLTCGLIVPNMQLSWPILPSTIS